MSPTRAGRHQHQGARGPSSNGDFVSARLCAPFAAEAPSGSMKMRSMSRERLLALAPFALVAALAAGVALAGFIASPHARAEPTGTPASSAAPVPTAVSASPEAKASPTSAPSATGSVPKSYDAAEMLRVHNEVRAGIGAS